MMLFSFSDLRTTNAATTPTSITNLSCYDCSESFKYIWEPYTACQYYPQSTPLRPCLGVERYCKVSSVTHFTNIFTVRQKTIVADLCSVVFSLRGAPNENTKICQNYPADIVNILIVVGAKAETL
jgi:hypothetical protein